MLDPCLGSLGLDPCLGSFAAEAHGCLSIINTAPSVVDFLADCVPFQSTISDNSHHAMERESFVAGSCAGGAKWTCDPPVSVSTVFDSLL